MDVKDEEEVEVEDEVEEIMEGEEEVNEYAGIDLNVTEMEALLAMLAGGVGVPLTVLASTYAKDGIEAVKRLVKGKTVKGEEGMDEMKKELDELRSELHETNLLNAKLLYTNKIFRSKNLSESHKVKVLESFDKAETVKEVKLVFETLNSELKEKAPIKENLGSASKPLGVAPSKAPIVEVDSQVARWQKLAGIR